VIEGSPVRSILAREFESSFVRALRCRTAACDDALVTSGQPSPRLAARKIKDKKKFIVGRRF
jgi:hypothetical protein